MPTSAKKPGKDGTTSGRTVGQRNGYMGDGKKKMGPGSGKNAGDGAGT